MIIIRRVNSGLLSNNLIYIKASHSPTPVFLLSRQPGPLGQCRSHRAKRLVIRLRRQYASLSFSHYVVGVIDHRYQYALD